MLKFLMLLNTHVNLGHFIHVYWVEETQKQMKWNTGNAQIVAQCILLNKNQ